MEREIKAFLNLDDAKTEIGTMVENQGKIYFKYHPDFISSGLEISPFKMKLSNEILTPKETYLEGLFGKN
nr:HipA N-terminal domain-containing protein [uncultured Flavobacterium sp.]